MVFCYQNCSDLLREKNCCSDREQLLKLEAEGQEFAKKKKKKNHSRKEKFWKQNTISVIFQQAEKSGSRRTGYKKFCYLGANSQTTF